MGASYQIIHLAEGVSGGTMNDKLSMSEWKARTRPRQGQRDKILSRAKQPITTILTTNKC